MGKLSRITEHTGVLSNDIGMTQLFNVEQKADPPKADATEAEQNYLSS